MKRAMLTLFLGTALIGPAFLSQATASNATGVAALHVNDDTWCVDSGQTARKLNLLPSNLKQYNTDTYIKAEQKVTENAKNLRVVNASFFSKGWFFESEYEKYIKELYAALPAWIENRTKTAVSLQNLKPFTMEEALSKLNQSILILSTKPYATYQHKGTVPLSNLLVSTWAAVKNNRVGCNSFLNILLESTEPTVTAANLPAETGSKAVPPGKLTMIGSNGQVFHQFKMTGPQVELTEWRTADGKVAWDKNKLAALPYFQNVANYAAASCTPMDYWYKLAPLYNEAVLQQIFAQDFIENFESFMSECGHVAQLAHDFGAGLVSLVPKLTRLTVYSIVYGAHTVNRFYNFFVWAKEKVAPKKQETSTAAINPGKKEMDSNATLTPPVNQGMEPEATVINPGKKGTVADQGKWERARNVAKLVTGKFHDLYVFLRSRIETAFNKVKPLPSTATGVTNKFDKLYLPLSNFVSSKLPFSGHRK